MQLYTLAVTNNYERWRMIRPTTNTIRMLQDKPIETKIKQIQTKPVVVANNSLLENL